PEIAAEELIQRQKEEWLPAGLSLQIALKTPINSRTAYAGDAVEASLTAPVRNSQRETLLPENAVLQGILTQLQAVYEPETYYYLRIQFNSASFRGRTYLMRAIHKPTGKEAKTLSSLYRNGALPVELAEAIRAGTIVIHASQVKLDRKFQGEWQTITPDKTADAENSK
ncbi:MAG: hypothetical protein M3Y24_04495, partial [Acidobacteriota bacterium]|nr:hypothetical protein [Acidobacteriota bacterium]